MDLERDFAAWADRRDPDALTRVFDGTAGRLLLLAAHLGGGGAAEDLVQATFLAAMTRACTWDRRRPLWPWLAAILQNEALMNWRRAQRRREVGIEAAAESRVLAPDPAQLAASEESFAVLLRAIDALPLPYRQVLRLRLVHGLQQIEIARALEIPVGTVRAQVHRGLAQLRDALPAGVVVLIGAWLTGEGALLAQVRARVLAEATALHAAAAVTPVGVLLTGGWWTVNGKTVAVVSGGALLLLCLCFAIGFPPGLARSEPPPVPSRPIVAGVDASKEQPATDPSGQDPHRTDARTAEPLWPLIVSVRTHSGKPVAGATIQVWVAARGSAWGKGQGDGGREEVANGVTEGDGIFRCGLDQFRERSSLFRCMSWVFAAGTVAGADYQETVVALPRTTEPRVFEAELELTQAVGIRGRVVDGSGVPVADATIHLVARGTVGFYQSWLCRPDGTFCIRAPDDLDGWPPRVAAVHPVHGTAVADVPRPESMPDAGTSVEVGDLVLDGRDAIRGQVVLGDNSALAHFPLHVFEVAPEIANDATAIERSMFQVGRKKPDVLALRHGRPVQLIAYPTTDAGGSFTCAGLDPDATYAVGVRDSALRMAGLIAARPGGEPVRLVVERQLLTLDVRSDRGEALRGAQLLVDGYDPGSKTPVWKERPGFPATGQAVGNATQFVDPDGRRRLLSPMGWIWRIGVSDENAHDDVLRHDAFPGVYRTERTLVLRPASGFGSLHLVVADEQGEAYQEYGFWLHCLERDVERNYDRLVPPADCMYRELPAGRWRLTVSSGVDLPYRGWPKSRGTQEQDIVIEDGRTTDVKIVTRPLGRVAVHLHADVALGELKELHLRNERDGTELTYDTYPATELIANRDTKTPVLLIRQAMPAGKYWFVVTAKGYEPARCEAEVAVDRVADIEVQLVRQ